MYSEVEIHRGINCNFQQNTQHLFTRVMARRNRSTVQRSGLPMTKTGIARVVRQVVEDTSENKRLVFLDNTNLVSNTGTVVNISNNIVQGDNISDRTGDQIRVLHQTLYVRGTAITDNQSIRFIWFKDNTNRGTTPAVTEVLDTASVTSQYNGVTLQQRRFTIYHDLTLDLSLNGEIIKHDERVVNRRQQIFYNGAAAVASANGPGATFVLVIGSHATGQWDASAMIRFLDQ